MNDVANKCRELIALAEKAIESTKEEWFSEYDLSNLFSGLENADAEFVAKCSPDTIRSLCETLLKYREALGIATGALRTTVGYEPFKNSLEPHRCSEALTKISAALNEAQEGDE